MVLDLFFGAAEHRLLLGHLPMTGEFIADVVDVILAGIGPGEASPGSGPQRLGLDLHQPGGVEQASHDHRGRRLTWRLARAGWASGGTSIA